MSDASPGTQAASSTGLSANVAGALAYLVMPLTGLVFFVIEKESRFVRFHAAQSIVLGLGLVAANIVLAVLGGILGAIPFVGWIFASLLSLVVGLACFAIWLVLMFRAFQGQQWEVPYAAEYARKLADNPPHAA